MSRQLAIFLNLFYLWKFPTLSNAVDYISDGLKRNLPIAMLNYKNDKLKDIKINPDDEKGHIFQFHWVTITEIDTSDSTNPMITVSSWGKKVRLNLKNVMNSLGFGGMIYFE